MLAAIPCNLSGSAGYQPAISHHPTQPLMKICSSIVFTALPRFLFSSFPRATCKALRKAALLLFSIAVLLASGTAAVRGQSALDGFDPNANGLVTVVVVQPDGKILLGGNFTTLTPNGGAAVPRN